MHERGDVHHLQDDRKAAVVFGDATCRTTGQHRQRGADAFAGSLAHIGNVALNRRIERLRLHQNRLFNLLQFRADQFEWKGKRTGRWRWLSHENLGRKSIRFRRHKRRNHAAKSIPVPPGRPE